LNHRPELTRRRADVVCFSIIDWSFRYQRPQQLMSQFAANGHRVFYINLSRPLAADASPRFALWQIKPNLWDVSLAVDRPLEVYRGIVEGTNLEAVLASLDDLRRAEGMDEVVGCVMIASWGAVALEARRRWGWRVHYDCMDEWDNFPGIAP